MPVDPHIQPATKTRSPPPFPSLSLATTTSAGIKLGLQALHPRSFWGWSRARTCMSGVPFGDSNSGGSGLW